MCSSSYTKTKYEKYINEACESRGVNFSFKGETYELRDIFSHLNLLIRSN